MKKNIAAVAGGIGVEIMTYKTKFEKHLDSAIEKLEAGTTAVLQKRDAAYTLAKGSPLRVEMAKMEANIAANVDIRKVLEDVMTDFQEMQKELPSFCKFIDQRFRSGNVVSIFDARVKRKQAADLGSAAIDATLRHRTERDNQ